MSSDLSGLHLDITGDSSGAQSSLDELNVRLTQLEAAFKGSSSATEGATHSLERHGVVVKDANSGLEAMASHAGTVGRALSSMGLEAEGAAARIEGMVGVFKEMEAAVPELLAIGAALTALSSAFDFVKDGIESAAKFQGQMETLEAAVRAQGGAWEELSGKIKDFVASESLASGFTQNDLVAAMNQLVTAGTSVADAMTLVSVAEETAVAHHKSVLEVTQMLIEAEAGRGTTLAQLDPKIRQMIQAHAQLSTVLQQLHKDNQDQISDAGSEERVQASAKAAWDQLSQSIGQTFLPLITESDYALIGLGKAFSDLGKLIGDLALAFVDAGGVAEHFVVAVSDATHGDMTGAIAQLGALKDAAKGVKDEFGASMNAMSGDGNLWLSGMQITAAAQAKHDARLAGGIHLENNPTLGLGRGKHGGGSSAGYNPQNLQAQAIDEQALVASHNALATSSNSVHAAYEALNQSVNQTMDSEKQNELAVKQLQDAYDKAKAAMPQLIADIKEEAQAQHNAQQATQLVYGEYKNAVDALNKYEQSLQGKTKLTADEKKELNALKDAVKESSEAYKTEDTNLKNITKSLTEHQKQLENDTKAMNAFNAEQQKLVVGLNDAKEAADKRVKDEETTYGKSLEDQIQYFAQRYNNAVQADEEYFQEHHAHNEALVKDEEEYYKKLLDLQLQQWKQQQDTAKKAQQQEVTDVQNFLDDIILKHKSFKDVFKSIWDDIVKIFIDDMAKMIAESALFKTIFGNLGGGAGGGFLGSLIGLGASAGTGAFSSSIMGTGMDWFGITGVPGSIASSALHVNIAGASPGVFGGGSGGGGGLGGFLTGGGVGSILGGAAIGVGVGSLMGGVMHDGPGNNNAILGSLLGVGGAGLLAAGGSLAGVGMSGALAGLLASGPAGWAVLLGGAILGGAVGGLFGNHDNPAAMPDKYNTGTWGQDNANLWGAGVGSNSGNPMIANGQQFTMDPNLAKATGNKGLLQYIGQYIQQTGGAGLSQQQIKEFTGENVAVPIPSGKDGNLTLANGQTYNWQQLNNDAMQAFQAIQNLGTAANGAATAIYNVTHSFPDWQNPTVALGGNYTPGGPTSGIQPPTNKPPGGTNPPGGPGTGTNPPGTHGPVVPVQPPIGGRGRVSQDAPPLTVHVNVGGVVGMTKDDLAGHVANTIAEMMRRGVGSALQTTL